MQRIARLLVISSELELCFRIPLKCLFMLTFDTHFQRQNFIYVTYFDVKHKRRASARKIFYKILLYKEVRRQFLLSGYVASRRDDCLGI